MSESRSGGAGVMNTSRLNSIGHAVRPAHRRILVRLDTMLRDIRTDPSFRRSLKSDPRAILAGRGFDPTDIPTTLPPVRKADVLLTHGQLFGLARETAAIVAPLELRLLAYGLKPLALVHGRESELAAFLNWAEARSYTALLSPNEWDRIDDEGKGGYSNLTAALRRAGTGSQAWRSLLVGPDEDRVVLAWLALALGWDELLGRLLGYPTCCAAAFVHRWPTAVACHQGDLTPIVMAASGLGPHDARANILGRYFGIELIQHLPCRFDCEATLAEATQVEFCLQAWEPTLAEQARTVLAAPALYTERDGVVILTGAEVRLDEGGLIATYDPAATLVTRLGGSLDLALRRSRMVRSSSSSSGFIIGDRAFQGWFTWFANNPHPLGRAHAVSQCARA